MLLLVWYRTKFYIIKRNKILKYSSCVFLVVYIVHVWIWSKTLLTQILFYFFYICFRFDPPVGWKFLQEFGLCCEHVGAHVIYLKIFFSAVEHYRTGIYFIYFIIQLLSSYVYTYIYIYIGFLSCNKKPHVIIIHNCGFSAEFGFQFFHQMILKSFIFSVFILLAKNYSDNVYNARTLGKQQINSFYFIFLIWTPERNKFSILILDTHNSTHWTQWCMQYKWVYSYVVI